MGEPADKISPPVLADTGNGFSVFYRNRFLYSRRFPAKHPEETAAAADILPGTLVLLFSPLLGYGVRTLLQHVPDGVFVLAVEHDAALFQLTRDFFSRTGLDAGENKCFRLIFAPEPETVTHFLDEGLSGHPPFRRCIRLDLSGGAALYAGFYRQAEFLAAEYVSVFWKNRATLIRLGRKYAENIFKNCGELAAGIPDAILLQAGAVRKPLVVAGAGPSLGMATGFLRENRKGLFLLAVEAAVPALQAAGIRPDLIITVEAQIWINRAFCGNYPDCRFPADIPVLADFTSRPQKRGKKKHTSFFLTPYTRAEFLRRLASKKTACMEIPPLGSVGLAALEAAGKLRANITLPVFFTGLDFSWGSGFSHAEGTPQVRECRIRADRLSPLEEKRAEAAFAGVRTGTQNGGIFSNEAMRGYAKLCAARFAGKGFFRLGKGGLPDGFPSAAFSAAAQEIRKHPPAGNPESGPAPESGAENGIRRRAADFLQEEEQRLLNLRAILTGADKTADNAGLSRLLQEADYLYLHFPDYTGAESVSLRRDFLNRVRVELEFFLKIIRTARGR